MFTKGNKLSVGNSGGKSMNSKILMSKVRTLTLKKIEKLLEKDEKELDSSEYELMKGVLLRLAGSILPRLNEHTGEDGGDMQISIKVESGSYQEKVLKEKGIIN